MSEPPAQLTGNEIAQRHQARGGRFVMRTDKTYNHGDVIPQLNLCSEWLMPPWIVVREVSFGDYLRETPVELRDYPAARYPGDRYYEVTPGD